MASLFSSSTGLLRSPSSSLAIQSWRATRSGIKVNTHLSLATISTRANPASRSTPRSSTSTDRCCHSSVRSFSTSPTTMSATATDTLIELAKARRTYYKLGKKSPVPDSKIEELVKTATLHMPSSFNTQSTRGRAAARAPRQAVGHRHCRAGQPRQDGGDPGGAVEEPDPAEVGGV
ncbi:hypothetical protein VTN77DRAFT_3383 [Rasamsonia byssochlamydoides]|uniref:uncharacterized protein n=1 Tax=Rasamsonia byssochlamydoides TaxID=89139 RepID=UPI003743BE42